MIMQNQLFLATLNLLIFQCSGSACNNPKSAEMLRGHLQSFGQSGPKFEIETLAEFPAPVDFFNNYVIQSKPLKLSGVALESRAVRLWTDDYLLSLDVPLDSVVFLETKKKETRLQETDEMHFHQFLKTYNQTEHYMVDDVPTYLRPDIMVPCSLQCPKLMEDGFTFALMWFSSGGTKSVIHTDAYDNINCLIRGQKTFVLVDPAKHRRKINLHSNGSYSDIDVDRVDLTKYPSLAEMEFYHVNVTAGDCLYIPYRWIHQVRSYNSNVAVNFWWDHYAAVSLLQQSETACQGHCDPSLTLDKVDLVGLKSYINHLETVRDFLKDATMNGPITSSSLTDMFTTEFEFEAGEIGMKFFTKLDLNQDGIFTTEEHAEVPVEIWKEIQTDMSSLLKLLEERDKEENQQDLPKDEL